MKILALLSGPIVSGKELIGISVLKNLQDKGHQVTVISNGWNDGHFPSLLNKNGISNATFKLGWYYAKKIQWSLNSIIHLPGAWYKYYNIYNTFNPDVIYIDTYRFVLLLYPFINKPLVFHVHDAHSHTAKDKLLIQKIQHKTSCFISISNFIKQDLLQCNILANKIKTVYNGINVPISCPNRQATNSTLFTVGIVGQVALRKGHKDLIEACALLAKQIPICIKIFGHGLPNVIDDINNLIAERGLQKQVLWMGFVNEKKNIYNNIDVLVAITHSHEPFGLIAAEAQAFALPVIVSNCGGLVEIVEDNITGFVIEPKNSKALAKKLLYLYENPSKRKLMGEAGYASTKQKFSETTMHNQIETILQTTASNKK